jgi:hypothetical protein
MKKILAREWSYLLYFCLFGFIVFPAILSLLATIGNPDKVSFGNMLKDFHKALGNGEIGAYLLAFVPYIVFQFIRSLKWAIKEIRRK